MMLRCYDVDNLNNHDMIGHCVSKKLMSFASLGFLIELITLQSQVVLHGDTCLQLAVFQSAPISR